MYNSNDKLRADLLAIAELIQPGEKVLDLGCGDGRLLFTALEKGAGKCVGIDIDSKALSLARETAKTRRLDDRLTFIEGDMLEQYVSEATVIICYLFPEALIALRPKLERELKPGTRFVSEAFTVPGWKETLTREINNKQFHLYLMPPVKENRSPGLTSI